MSPGSRRRGRRGPLLAMAVLAVAVVAILVAVLHKPHNVSHPHVEFTTTTATPKPVTTPKSAFLWPRYGYDAARTRLFPGGKNLDPPFNRGWTYRGSALLEFPPVIRRNAMYALDDSGEVVAIDMNNGRVFWRRQVGTLGAASPALARGLVLVPLLSTVPGSTVPDQGRFVALSQSTGRVVWSMNVPSGSESSPLVWGRTLYFGDQAGTVYAIQVQTGHILWTYHAAGPVKGGVAYWNGNVYFADYDGRAYALNAKSGAPVWAVSTDGADDGFGSGNFYATPAVAFGRVYIGNTDGYVYSFAAATGQLAWSTGTGAYVYSSPAVADIPGLGPTVFIGSYSDYFYAFNAQSGAVRWSYNAGGRISGSPTIIGDVVYFSNLASKTTTGLNVRTGHVAFSFPAGAFTPVIADPSALFLVGYGDIFQLLPKRAARSNGGATATTAGH